MIAAQLRKIIAKSAEVEEDLIHLEHPDLEEHGDYSTNIALVLKGGRKLAEEIAVKIVDDRIEKVEVAGPGFINIKLNQRYLLQAQDLVLTPLTKTNKKIMFEYGQPNTHKLPHIAHLFSYMFGESMSRILESAGHTVRRVNYQGDVGLHVAKCLWAFKKTSPVIPTNLKDKVSLLQKMYQEGSKSYEEDSDAKSQIHVINKQIYIADPEIFDLWNQTRQWSIDYYQQFERRIGIHFDKYYFESQIAQAGINTVRSNIGSVFTESQGAVVYEGEKVGLHTRVFISSEGNPTYEAKDLALELQKMTDWPADALIIATATEQNGYFDVVFSALEQVNPALRGKLQHIGFGMINLKSGKMSSRTGNIIGGIDLVDQVVAEVSKMNSDPEIAEKVGIGAIKYAFLKKSPSQDMEFDIDSSISIEGNSGPYLQYTYARSRSVMRKSELINSELKGQKSNMELNPEELSILRWVYRYPEIIEEAAGRQAPNLLTNYLYELAQRFNTFYNSHTIVGSDTRIKITKSVSQILHSGLNLLGIEALEKM
jgi:arginyl-tRNA synthetase